MTPPSSDSAQGLRVLVLAPTGRDAALASTMLKQAGLLAMACPDMPALCAALMENVGVLLIADEALAPQALSTLATHLDNQPAWSDIPVVIFASNLQNSAAHARATMILRALGNAVFVERPVRLMTLVTAIKNATRVRQRQYEVRRVLDDLAQREAEARASVQFLQQLLGIVSHDLRNPISAVLISGETLLRRQDLNKKQEGGVRRIIQAARRANSMVLDLLDFTRARLGRGMPLRLEPFDLHRLARDIVDEISAAHPGRNVELTLQGNGVGHWDAGRMAQVLQNLCNNALQYSPADSPVRVAIAQSAPDDDSVTIEVHNVGDPITTDMRLRMFEPMERGRNGGAPDMAVTSADNRSIGLGLYIVKQIVAAHQGAVEVTSSAAAGTRFTVKLPRFNACAASSARSHASSHDL